jgi:hypothetical protein
LLIHCFGSRGSDQLQAQPILTAGARPLPPEPLQCLLFPANHLLAETSRR